MGILYKYKKAYKKSMHEKRSILQKIAFLPIDTYFFINEQVLPTRLSILLTFKRIYGFFPSFTHPKTLNEKLQWKKLYDTQKFYTMCADKYAVREYIAQELGKKYLTPLLYETTDPDTIDFSKLPKRKCA